MIGRLALLGILDVLRRPWSLTATVAGVAVTVFLGGLFALAATAVDGAFANGRGQAQFQIYWKVGADAGLTARQMDWMRALPGVVEARAFTPEQALAVMRQSLGKGADLTFPAAGQNPLPATMIQDSRASDAGVIPTPTRSASPDDRQGVASAIFLRRRFAMFGSRTRCCRKAAAVYGSHLRERASSGSVPARYHCTGLLC